MYGYRKLSVMILLVAVGVGFRLAGLINGAEMVDLLKISAGSFFAANLVSKFAKDK